MDNDIEFKLEDRFADYLAPFQADLPPIRVSLLTETLDDEAHVAIICDSLDAEQLTRRGNWSGEVRLKVVTMIDEVVPDGYDTLRDLHRFRCATVRDNVMIVELDDELSGEGITVQGFSFGKVNQRIQGRSWVTEFTVNLHQVAAIDEV